MSLSDFLENFVFLEDVKLNISYKGNLVFSSCFDFKRNISSYDADEIYNFICGKLGKDIRDNKISFVEITSNCVDIIIDFPERSR